MKFTVVWHPHTQRQLAYAWLTASDRGTLSQAADEIDQTLAQRPLHVGEERTAGLRKLVVGPLAVLYAVSEDDCLVRVIALRLIQN